MIHVLTLKVSRKILSVVKYLCQMDGFYNRLLLLFYSWNNKREVLPKESGLPTALV